MHDENFIDYATGFVQECYDQGLSEEQTDALYQEMVKSAAIVGKGIQGIGKGVSFLEDLIWRGTKASGRGGTSVLTKGKNAITSTGKWVMPKATTTATGGKAYTGGELAKSLLKGGLVTTGVGGTGYGLYRGGNYAWDAFRPVGEYSSAGGIDSYALENAGRGESSSRAGGTSSGGARPSALSDIYGRPVGESASTAATTSAAGGTSAYKRVSGEMRQTKERLNEEISSMQKQIDEYESRKYEDRGAWHKAESLRKQLANATRQRSEINQQLVGMVPTYQEQESRYQQNLAKMQQRAAMGHYEQQQNVMSQIDSLERERNAAWGTQWAHKLFNRARGISPDAADREMQLREQYEADVNAVRNAPRNPYF